MDISVVVCTYNRSKSLKRFLDSAAAMEVPASLSWQLIVVNNNSTDDTKNVIEEFAKNSGLNVVPLFEATPGVTPSRNLAIRSSKGEILAFTDDDALASRDWLAQIKRGFDEYQPACLGGRILCDPELPLPQWWDKGWNRMLGHFDRGDQPIVAGSGDREEYAWGGNFSFHRDVFEKYGPFRSTLGRTPKKLGLGADSEIVLRLRLNGEKVVYYPGAEVIHSPDVRRLSKQYLRRLNYRLGVSTCTLDKEYPKHWPRILRIPRWRYKWAAQTLWNAARHGFNGASSASFQRQLNLIMLAGYSVTAFRGQRS